MQIKEHTLPQFSEIYEQEEKEKENLLQCKRTLKVYAIEMNWIKQN